MRLGLPSMLLVGTLVACAPTIGPVSLPVEVLVVLDRNEKSLIVIPVDSVGVADTIPLTGIGIAAPTHLAVHGNFAAVGYSDSTAVEIVDLAAERSINTVRLETAFGNPIGGLAFGDDGTGYAALPSRNHVATFSPYTAGAGLVGGEVSGGPQGFGVARGTVFVVAGNRQACFPVPQNCTNPSNAPSFLISATSGYKDSLALSGPGNASAAVFAPDGFLYVLNSGNGNIDGRLSQFDPVQLSEVNLFGGFGPLPQFLASDGGERLFVASATKGLMVFNTTTRRLVIGADQGIPLSQPRGLATDALGRLYVLEAGGCAPGQQGQVRVFGTDLIEVRHIPTGICPVAVAVTEIPSDIFHLNH